MICWIGIHRRSHRISKRYAPTLKVSAHLDSPRIAFRASIACRMVPLEGGSCSGTVRTSPCMDSFQRQLGNQQLPLLQARHSNSKVSRQLPTQQETNYYSEPSIELLNPDRQVRHRRDSPHQATTNKTLRNLFQQLSYEGQLTQLSSRCRRRRKEQ